MRKGGLADATKLHALLNRPKQEAVLSVCYFSLWFGVRCLLNADKYSSVDRPGCLVVYNFCNAVAQYQYALAMSLQ
jgi:hypothetical protein